MLVVFGFPDESTLPSLALLICGEVETVIHVNGRVKDTYTIYLFYMLFSVIMNLQTRSTLFLYNMVVVVHVARLIKINCYFQVYYFAGHV